MPHGSQRVGGQQKPLPCVQFNDPMLISPARESLVTPSRVRERERWWDDSDEKAALMSLAETDGNALETGKRRAMNVDAPRNDHMPSDVPFTKLEDVHEVTDERAHLQTLDSIAAARPPWWLRRWTELQFFLNSARRRAKLDCSPAEATVEQLTADVAAADALYLAVVDGVDGGFWHASARALERIERDEIEMGAVSGREGVMAHVEPPWLRVGTAARVTRELSQHLVARLQELLGKLDTNTGDGPRWLLGTCEGGEDFDGTQRHWWLCPALKRVHASIMMKALIMDLFASPMHLHRERAQRISDGFLAQCPLIHAEYITDGDAQPVYDAAGLQPPQMNALLMPGARDALTKHRSFIIHIDYIRFRPCTGAVPQRTDIVTGHDSPPWSAMTLNSIPITTVSNNNNINDGHHVSPTVSFTPEEHLISRILDNYEPYRMMQLNLLPHLKNRHFYQDQLESLCCQSHPTDEQNRLKATLSQLFQMTCKLEQMYLREMVLAWRQITRLRGEASNEGRPFQSGHLGFHPSRGGMDSETSAPCQVSMGNTDEWSVSQHNLPAATDTTASLLIDTLEAQGSSSSPPPPPPPPVSRFQMRWLPSRSGRKREVVGCGDRDGKAKWGRKEEEKEEDDDDDDHIEEENLLDYVPVISGVSAVAQHTVPANGTTSHQQQFGDEVVTARSPLFQVLVFARTNAVVPPQFVGSTAPRALSAAKVLFFNETFELHTMQEPREILLHIVSVEEGSDDHVVATVRVPPSLTHAYLLLPLQTPISFMHSGHTHSKSGGGFLPGVISLSTTWTTTQGMTLEEIEDIFLRGEADPMDPKYEQLLRILKSHYIESRKRMLTGTRARTAEHPHLALGGSEAATTRRSCRNRRNGRAHESDVSVESERLRLLRRRWLIRTGHAVPQDDLESRLFSLPIPLEDIEGHELQRRLRRIAARKRRETREHDPLFHDTMHDDADVPFPLVLSLSPLTGRERLKVWQDRLRYIKARHISSRNLEDHELLERYVVLPKLRAAKVIRLTPESHLNPRREERPNTDDINREALMSRQDSRVVVHIMKATGLPQRVDSTLLEPFVEVNFVYETVHSRSEVGTSPSWFETLNIPFCPPDFDNETLSLIEDDIVISLYDKLEIQMPPTTVMTGALSHETHYRTERRLIGTLRVPFFSLYGAEQALIEGQFPLSTPRWMLGYHPGGTGPDGGLSLLHTRHGESLHSHPCIQLYVALWPPLRRTKRKELDQPTISRFLMQLNVSAQLQHLHGVAVKWRRDALKKIKGLSSVNPAAHKREIEPFVFCTTGDLTLVCRYLLASGGPPPLRVQTVEEAIRFVSLLPSRIDGITRGDNEVWCTHAEFLRTREGGYGELSLLLAHFLLHLSPDEVTFVVTGRGTLHHHLVMVLHSFDGELRLIDPRTGSVRPVHDPFLTFFRDVHMVISHDQLWANIQLSGTPHRMNWSLHDRRFWLQCFDHEDDDVKACLPFIAGMQREVLSFLAPDPHQVQEIEQQLQKAVRGALVLWRNNRPPAFHHGVAAVLRTLLEDAETELCKYGNVRRDAVTMRAAELLKEYFGEDVLQGPRHYRGRNKVAGQSSTTGESVPVALNAPSLRMVGSPVNAAYNPRDTAYRHILQHVFETSVHEVGTNSVSFAIAVYVKGYTNEVYSMWVFLVALCEATV